MKHRIRNLVAVCAFVTIAAVGSASAQQSTPPSNPAILDAVRNLQTSVAAIQSTLTKLQQSVDNINQALSQSNVRFTPLVGVPLPNLASCTAVNVASQPRTIHIEILDVNGAVAEDLGTKTIQPGKATGGGNRTAGSFYCKFTVTDGNSSDIRGDMQICTNTACGLNTIAAE